MFLKCSLAGLDTGLSDDPSPRYHDAAIRAPMRAIAEPVGTGEPEQCVSFHAAESELIVTQSMSGRLTSWET